MVLSRLALITATIIACVTWMYGGPRGRRAATVGFMATIAAATTSATGIVDGRSKEQMKKISGKEDRNAEDSESGKDKAGANVLENNIASVETVDGPELGQKQKRSIFDASRAEWKSPEEKMDPNIAADKDMKNDGKNDFTKNPKSSSKDTSSSVYSYSSVKLGRESVAPEQPSASVKSNSDSRRDLFRQSREEFETSTTRPVRTKAPAEKVDIVGERDEHGNEGDNPQVNVYRGANTQIPADAKEYTYAYALDTSRRRKAQNKSVSSAHPSPPTQISVARVLAMVVRGFTSILNDVALPFLHVLALLWHDTKACIMAPKLAPDENPYFIEEPPVEDKKESTFYSQQSNGGRQRDDQRRRQKEYKGKWDDLSPEEQQVVKAKEAAGHVWSFVEQGWDTVQKNFKRDVD